ncbi:MAG: dTMP kinase, partial [Alphaproteobacteria bacterium]|nr:dTMP kinase [Alphaproteobacteria bacterium]
MSESREQGFFITIEGGEGSGKTTQIERLVEVLNGRGREVIVTREPGGTDEAEAIRALLVQRDGGDWSAMAEVLLLFAARVMHVRDLIKPALKQGKVVICDRFTDSTIAYQGYGRGLDITKIRKIERLTLDDFRPDLTFVLDIDAKTGLSRSKKRLSEVDDGAQTEDRFERLDLSFHETLREGFLEIARRDEERCYILNASQSMDDLAE